MMTFRNLLSLLPKLTHFLLNKNIHFFRKEKSFQKILKKKKIFEKSNPRV